MTDILSPILARVLGAPAAPDDATPIAELPGMDSLKFMQLISAIEEAAGEGVDVEALAGAETVGDLRRMLA